MKRPFPKLVPATAVSFWTLGLPDGRHAGQRMRWGLRLDGRKDNETPYTLQLEGTARGPDIVELSYPAQAKWVEAFFEGAVAMSWYDQFSLTEAQAKKVWKALAAVMVA